MRRSAESKFGYRVQQAFSLSFQLFRSQRSWNTLEGTKSTRTFSFRSAKKERNIKKTAVLISVEISRASRVR